MKKSIIVLSIICLLFYNISYTTVQAQSNINTTNTTNVSANTSSDSEIKLNESLDSGNKPSVHSDSAIVMEASTGAILYSKNIHDIHYPASITKILTALVAIDNSSLGETVSFSRNAVFDVELDSSRIGIDVGEELTMEQSLYAIMLESANEVSYAIAEHVAGDVKSFASLMNQKAVELGCVDSNFVNPHGLPNDNHYTSAYDMALISRAAINNELFRKITGTRTYTIPPTNLQPEARPLANHHKFIKGDIPFDGAIGGKTGYTSVAGYTLVTFAKRNDMTLISVIMHCDTIPNEYSDTAALLNYGFDNYSIYNIADNEGSINTKTNSLFTKYSPLFDKSTSQIQVSENGSIVLPKGISFKEAKKEVTFNPIKTLNSGDNIIGTINFTYNNTFVGSTDIIYHNVESPYKLNNSFIPTPAKTELAKGIAMDTVNDSRSLKGIIIGIIIGVILIAATLYTIFVEIPYRKRRNAYTEKKKRRHGYYSKSDYIDF